MNSIFEDLQRYAVDKDETHDLDYEVGYDDYTGWGLLDAGNIMEHIDKDEYVIRHYYENFTFIENTALCGIDDDGILPAPCDCINFGNDEIEFGAYGVNVHSLNGSHSHSLNAGDVIIDAWPLNSYTNTVNAWLCAGTGGYG